MPSNMPGAMPTPGLTYHPQGTNVSNRMGSSTSMYGGGQSPQAFGSGRGVTMPRL
jgi:hypothetical protein